MCGGAIIYDYIPARRRVCASDFWPDADDSDPHTPAPEKRNFFSSHGLCFLLCFFFFLG